MTAPFGRRRFLQAAALAALTGPLLTSSSRSGADPAPTDGEALFGHGVASGDVTADRVVLWTRVALRDGQPRRLRWHLASDPQLTRIVADGVVNALPDDDGTVRVEVIGLRPGTTYWYGFAAEGPLRLPLATSAVGRTRTLPAAGVERVRMAVVSCSNLEAGWFNAYARVADRADLDLVVHLGDYIYEYGTGGGDVPDAAPPVPGREHSPRIELRRLDDYRGRYAQYRTDPDLQRLHATHPVLSIWDDHEVADDSWAYGAQAHQPEDGPWADRWTAAMTAWHEWHPRARTEPQAWRGFALGDLVDASLIDGRSHRPRRGDPAVPGAIDDGLGRPQREWLDARLATPTARWPVVLTQQPVTPRFGPNGVPLGFAGWSGFPVAQQALLDSLRTAKATVISGDVHGSWLLGQPGVTEAVVPSVTSRSFADRHSFRRARAYEQQLETANPDLRWNDQRHHGYLIVDADAERLRLEWWHVDSVTERTSGERLAHVHEVRS